MPNLGSSCYVNAVLWCLFALCKLRTDEELCTTANNFKTAKEHPMCQHDECKVSWKGASNGGDDDALMMMMLCGCHFCNGPVVDRENPCAQGMPNLGSSCYINAVLQCLFALGKLRTDEELGTITNNVKTTNEHPMCQHDQCNVTWKGASDGGDEDAMTMMMLRTECGASNYLHCVALWYDNPYHGYYFDCEQGLTLAGNSQNKDACTVAARNGKDNWGSDDVDGHASGIAHGDGYVIRGMPNLGTSCYMNALLQCLLALGKLRTVILGLDGWLGVTGQYLKQLFVETSSANDDICLLDPRMISDCVRGFDQQFKGNKKQQEYQFTMPAHQGTLPTHITAKALTSVMGCDKKHSASCRTIYKKSESHEGVQEAVPSCLLADTPVELLSSQVGQHSRAQNQGSGEQVQLDEEPAPIFVKKLDGSTLCLCVRLSDSTECLVDRIAERTVFSKDHYLEVEGKILQPNHDLRSNGVGKDCTVYRRSRMHGGRIMLSTHMLAANVTRRANQLPDDQTPTTELTENGCGVLRPLLEQ